MIKPWGEVQGLFHSEGEKPKARDDEVVSVTKLKFCSPRSHNFAKRFIT